MKLIFTSFKGVYVINTDRGNPHLIHTGLGMYYGLTWLGEKLYVAARHNYSDLSNNQNEKILVFNRKLEFVGKLFPWDNARLGFHSILADPKTNDLWITCPGSNKVVLLDVTTGRRRDFWPFPKIKGREYNHFNSLMIHGDNMLLNAHNGFIEPRGSVNSEILVCSRSKTPKVLDKIVFKGVRNSHCCFYVGDELCTCASDLGQIITQSGNALLPESLSGYTRGVVITKDRIVVGESQRAQRENRISADGWIHVYSRPDMAKVQTIHLPKIGQVAEIRALDTPDEHHSQVEPFHAV
jgi:hypothetical protein